MKDSKKKTTKKNTPRISGNVTPRSERAPGWSHSDTNEEIGTNNEPYGTPAFNFYYSVDSLPAMVRDALSDALSGLASTLGVSDPAETSGEVAGFKRLIKLCKAAAEQEKTDGPPEQVGTRPHESAHVEMKDNKKKATIKQPKFGPRGLNSDQELEVERIEREGGELANAAINFWTGIIFAQPFLKTAINDALTRAAALLGIANPATEDDQIAQLEKMLTLYKATGADFKLPRELTAADHVAAILNEVADDIPQDLFDLLCDYFEAKIKATENQATHPESVSLPSVRMVLAAGVAADRERQRMEK